MIMENSLSDMKRLVWKDIETIQQVADRKGFNRRLDLKRLKKDAKKNYRSTTKHVQAIIAEHLKKSDDTYSHRLNSHDMDNL